MLWVFVSGYKKSFEIGKTESGMQTICVRHASLLHLDPVAMRKTPIPLYLFERMLVRCEWPHVDGGCSKTFRVWSYIVDEKFSRVEDFYESLFGREYQLEPGGNIPTRMRGVVAIIFPEHEHLDDPTFRELFGVTRQSAANFGVESHWVVLQHSTNHRGNKSFIYFE